MSPPTIRDEVLLAWRGILLRANCRPTLVDALVLELEQAAEQRGARLPRRPRAEDPNAVALQRPPADAVRLAHAADDYQAARAALRAPEPPPAAPTTDHLPPRPDDPQEPQ